MSEKQIIDISFCIEPTKKKDKSLCQYGECKKRIKITDYPCKCGNIYCNIHKPPENHDCQYDYREIELKDKKIEQMKCLSNKMQKIS
jgi:hypothetical protein